MHNNRGHLMTTSTDKAEAVQTDADVTCELTVAVTCHCPIYEEIDHYDVTVAWDTAEATFEKHTLQDIIRSYGGSTLTQEDLCESLYDALAETDVSEYSVTVTDTKHMDMTVRKNA